MAVRGGSISRLGAVISSFEGATRTSVDDVLEELRYRRAGPLEPGVAVAAGSADLSADELRVMAAFAGGDPSSDELALQLDLPMPLSATLMDWS